MAEFDISTGQSLDRQFLSLRKWLDNFSEAVKFMAYVREQQGSLSSKVASLQSEINGLEKMRDTEKQKVDKEISVLKASGNSMRQSHQQAQTQLNKDINALLLRKQLLEADVESLTDQKETRDKSIAATEAGHAKRMANMEEMFQRRKTEIQRVAANL